MSLHGSQLKMIENQEDDEVKGKIEYILFQSGRSQVSHFFWP